MPLVKQMGKTMSQHKPGERDSSSEKIQGNLSDDGELSEDDLDGIAGGRGGRTTSRTTTSSSSLKKITNPTSDTSGGTTDTRTSSTPIVEETDSEREAPEVDADPVNYDRDFDSSAETTDSRETTTEKSSDTSGDAVTDPEISTEFDGGSEKPDSQAVGTSDQDSNNEPAAEQEPHVDESESDPVDSTDLPIEGETEEGSIEEERKLAAQEELILEEQLDGVDVPVPVVPDPHLEEPPPDPGSQADAEPTEVEIKEEPIEIKGKVDVSNEEDVPNEEE